MKITVKELKTIIAEAVDRKLQEAGVFGIDWDKMKALHAKGQLKGRWHVIMTAMVEAGGEPEKALALLKSAVAALELHKNKTHGSGSAETPASTEDMTNMGSDDML